MPTTAGAGAGPGTAGIDDAADHIAAVFREAGLSTAPGADGYFQPFSIQSERKLGDDVKLSFSLPNDRSIDGKLKSNFSPLAVGASGSFEKDDVVFAGFGITAEDEEHNLHYDDYKGLDVKDKVVLILRKEPDPKDKESGFSGDQPTSHATFQSKVANAARHGAAAVLLVNDTTSAGPADSLLDFNTTPLAAPSPSSCSSASWPMRSLPAAEMPSLDELEAKINETLEPQSKPLEGVKVTGSMSIKKTEIAVKNVIGVIEGEGPLADETSSIGAHYDHLGSGGIGSLAFGSRDIHNGADDNASGTSVVLEMARRLARRVDPLPRRVVFMLFSAEERGLLGSEHYVEHPLYPLDKTVAMVNFDMVGRLNEDHELTVFGAGTSVGFDDLVLALAHSPGPGREPDRGHPRRILRQRPRLVLQEGYPRPVLLHRHPRRLSPPQRRLRQDQL